MIKKFVFVVMMAMVCASIGAQSSYQLATTDGICLNGYEKVIKGNSASIVQFNLTSSQSYKVLIEGSDEMHIMTNSTTHVARTKEFTYEGGQTVTLYLQNKSKGKIKVVIALMLEQ